MLAAHWLHAALNLPGLPLIIVVQKIYEAEDVKDAADMKDAEGVQGAEAVQGAEDVEDAKDVIDSGLWASTTVDCSLNARCTTPSTGAQMITCCMQFHHAMANIYYSLR